MGGIGGEGEGRGVREYYGAHKFLKVIHGCMYRHLYPLS